MKEGRLTLQSKQLPEQDSRFIRFARWLEDYWVAVANGVATVLISSSGVVLSLPAAEVTAEKFISPLGGVFIVSTVVGLLLVVVQARRVPERNRLVKENQRLASQLVSLEGTSTEFQIQWQSMFENQLMSLANRCGLDHGERVSVYRHEGRVFVMMGRYSRNPAFREPGRSVYPDDQGCIAKTWRYGAAAELELPDPDLDLPAYVAAQIERWTIDDFDARSFVMKSRAYYGMRIETADGFQPLGVIIFESTRTGFLDEDLLREAVASEMLTMAWLLQAGPKPDPRYALAEGL